VNRTATDSTLILHQPDGQSVTELEDVLHAMFAESRDAVLAGRPVLIVLKERDVLGHGAPVDAAMAHALVGLVRALATEGIRSGWQINAVSLD
jgi:hypothetical protein